MVGLGTLDRRRLTGRAYEAVSFDEEKFRLLGTAYLARAAASRKAHFGKSEGKRQEQEEAERIYCKHVQELSDELQAAASQRVLADREVMLNSVLAFSELYYFCSGDLHDDPDILLAAMHQDPECLMYAGAEIRADRETMLRAIALDGLSLEYVSEELQDDRELALLAISQSPYALAYASPGLRADREVVLGALQRQEWAMHTSRSDNLLEYVSDELRADEEVVLEAVRSAGAAVRLACPDLRRNKDFLLRAMRTAPSLTRSTCYQMAEDSIKEEHTLEECLGASGSVLALRGDSAPVLTFKLGCWPGGGDPGGIRDVEVSLLSGACFTCSLVELSFGLVYQSATRDGGAESSPGSSISDSDSDSGMDLDDDCGIDSDISSTSSSAHGRQQSSRTQQKSPISNSSGSGLDPQTRSGSQLCTTVGHLARLVLARLPKHVQLEPRPDRIFVVFSKPDGSGEPVAVTPWDWNRPLIDFL